MSAGICDHVRLSPVCDAMPRARARASDDLAGEGIWHLRLVTEGWALIPTYFSQKISLKSSFSSSSLLRTLTRLPKVSLFQQTSQIQVPFFLQYISPYFDKELRTTSLPMRCLCQ